MNRLEIALFSALSCAACAPSAVEKTPAPEIAIQMKIRERCWDASDTLDSHVQKSRTFCDNAAGIEQAAMRAVVQCEGINRDVQRRARSILGIIKEKCFGGNIFAPASGPASQPASAPASAPVKNPASMPVKS